MGERRVKDLVGVIDAAGFEVEQVRSSPYEGRPGYRVEVTVHVLPLGLPEPAADPLERAPDPETGGGDADQHG